MAVPTGEFRSTSITLSEPSNRTTAGNSVDATVPIDFGTINNTNGVVQAGPKVLWWRCTNLAGFSTIGNMKFWLSSNSDLDGTNEYYCDITNTWTQNKTISQVSSGSPGTIPQSLPASNLTKIGGSDITGTGHTDTSQYIYLALSIGSDETIGSKGGANGNFQVSIKFDYS
ncbi:hypothetical protein IIB79_10410 [candidate division KSB1 bacterium]|nr:hypothetical protein [candidate division KSB1 bacterium]